MMLTGNTRFYDLVSGLEGEGRVQLRVPVSSLKAAGLSWSVEASMWMGVLHFWQAKPAGFLSLAIMLASRCCLMLEHKSKMEREY